MKWPFFFIVIIVRLMIGRKLRKRTFVWMLVPKSSKAALLSSFFERFSHRGIFSFIAD